MTNKEKIIYYLIIHIILAVVLFAVIWLVYGFCIWDFRFLHYDRDFFGMIYLVIFVIIDSAVYTVLYNNDSE